MKLASFAPAACGLVVVALAAGLLFTSGAMTHVTPVPVVEEIGPDPDVPLTWSPYAVSDAPYPSR